MRKIKVLHYIPGFDQGGIESRLLDWYRNIDRDQIQFDLVKLTPSKKNELLEEFVALGGNVYTLPRFSPKTFFSYITELKKIFNTNESYDVVHCHSASTGYFFLKESKKNGISKRILHSRTTQFNPESSFVPIRGFLKKSANYYATSFFACSEQAAIWQFGKEAYVENKVEIINNGIESQKFSFNPYKRSMVREELNLEKSFVVGHVGRFATAKNHLYLIDIFNEIVKIKPEAKLLLIGEGLTKESVQEKVEKMKLSDKVLFLGGKGNVEDYFQCMDVFVFPSQYEGFGTVTIEAQASGLKCIVSDKVPKEVSITNLVEHVPLSADPKRWADLAVSHSISYEREDTSTQIINAGFDTKSTAQYLSNFYICN